MKLAKYLRFLFTATNQHGIHSPFVYAFTTQCLYTKTRYPGRKTYDVLLKSIDYFNAGSISLHTRDKDLKTLVGKAYPEVTFEKEPYDLVYLDGARKAWSIVFLEASRPLPNSVLLVEGIHRDKNSETLWETLKSWDYTTVSIDLFYMGLVFFKRKQAKEHFKIRF